MENPLNSATKNLICYNLSKYDDLDLGSDVFRIHLSSKSIDMLPLYYREMLHAFSDVIDGDFVD